MSDVPPASACIPAEKAVIRRVPAEDKRIRLVVVQILVTRLLCLQKALQLPSHFHNFGPVFDRRRQKASDRLADTGRKIGIIAEDYLRNPPVEKIHDPFLRRLVAERLERPLKIFRAILAASQDDPKLALSLRFEPFYFQQCIPDLFAAALAEFLDNSLLFYITGHRTHSFAVFEPQKVHQQAFCADIGIVLVLDQAFCDMQRLGQGLLSGQIRIVRVTGGDVGHQLQPFTDSRQLRKRPEEQPPLRVMVPAFDRIAGHRLGHFVNRVDITQRVFKQHSHVFVAGANVWKIKGCLLRCKRARRQAG